MPAISLGQPRIQRELRLFWKRQAGRIRTATVSANVAVAKPPKKAI